MIFFTAANLGNQLVEMQEEQELGRFLTKLSKVDLLIIDELGYVQLSDRVTQLMFQIFSERYERGSILLNSNLEFKEWANVFHDERMTTAIIEGSKDESSTKQTENMIHFLQEWYTIRLARWYTFQFAIALELAKFRS